MSFEQPSAVPQEKKQALRTALETKEGEMFYIEQLTDPEDPRVVKVHKILADHFGEDEIDPINVTRQAIDGKSETGEKCAPYLIHVVEDPNNNEIKGVSTSAVVETVDAKGKVSKEIGVLLGCYALVSPEVRRKGIYRLLFKAREEAAVKDAERRGLKIKGFMGEVRDEAELALNAEGVRRLYVKTKDGFFKELPYEQPPLNWNSKTGEPEKGAGIVTEHLMLKLTSDENNISGKELMEMVRGMYYYNNYFEESYFENEEARQKHVRFIEEIEKKLANFIGRKKVRLLSAQERRTMQDNGAKFIEQA